MVWKPTNYRPQTKFAKVVFTGVGLSMGEGGQGCPWHTHDTPQAPRQAHPSGHAWPPGMHAPRHICLLGHVCAACMPPSRHTCFPGKQAPQACTPPWACSTPLSGYYDEPAVRILLECIHVLGFLSCLMSLEDGIRCNGESFGKGFQCMQEGREKCERCERDFTNQWQCKNFSMWDQKALFPFVP